MKEQVETDLWTQCFSQLTCLLLTLRPTNTQACKR